MLCRTFLERGQMMLEPLLPGGGRVQIAACSRLDLGLPRTWDVVDQGGGVPTFHSPVGSNVLMCISGCTQVELDTATAHNFGYCWREPIVKTPVTVDFSTIAFAPIPKLPV